MVVFWLELNPSPLRLGLELGLGLGLRYNPNLINILTLTLIARPVEERFFAQLVNVCVPEETDK